MQPGEMPDFRDFMAAGEPDAATVAHAGRPLPADREVAPTEAVIDALRCVHDPEIPVNIYDLGLIYRPDIAADGSVSIDMTLTAPACPVAGAMPGAVADAVASVEGVGEVEVRLVWEPPWSQDRMSEDARLSLDLF